jgi:hypothetical protein
MEGSMDSRELENLHRDIEELKRAVKRSNPFLRSIMEHRSYAVLSLPMGLITLAGFLALHFIALGYGSSQTLPEEWKSIAWIALAALMLIGLIAKLLIVNRNASEIEEGANLITATKAMYAGPWFLIMIPLALAMAVLSIFAVSVGHSWYVETALAMGLGLLCFNYGVATDRKELFVIGWYMIAAGLASVFFIESAPFLWSAVIWSGAFLAYGAAGLAFIKAEKRG